MTATRFSDQFDIKPTVGGGNCAFNAFVLGLCQKSMLDQIEAYYIKNKYDINVELKKFIEEAGIALALPPDEEWNWAFVKDELIRLRSDDPERLQELLRPVLRAAAFGLASAHAKEYCDNTIDALLDAYEEKLGSLRTLPDDIFLKHKCVKDFFDTDPDHEDVLVWWYNEGHKQFLAEMAKDGEWAGDIELKLLAEYFAIDLDILSIRKKEERGHVTEYKESLINVYSEPYGVLPKADVTPDQRADLLRRGVVAHSTTDQLPVIGDYAMLIRRLSEVPDIKLVRDFLATGKNELPTGWSQDVYDELTARSVVKKTKAGYVLDSAMAADDRLVCIEAFANPKVLQQLLDHAKIDAPPKLTVSNLNALHYSFAEPKAAEKVLDKTATAKVDPVVTTAAPDLSATAKAADKDVLEVAPSPPAPAQVFTPAANNFLTTVSVDKIKKVFTDPKFKDWQVSDPITSGTSTYRSVTEKGKEKIQIHDTKMTTENFEQNTYVAMLKIFRNTQPDGTFPKITTQSGATKALWEKACADVYADKKVDWSLYISLQPLAAAATPAPARPVI